MGVVRVLSEIGKDKPRLVQVAVDILKLCRHATPSNQHAVAKEIVKQIQELRRITRSRSYMRYMPANTRRSLANVLRVAETYNANACTHATAIKHIHAEAKKLVRTLETSEYSTLRQAGGQISAAVGEA